MLVVRHILKNRVELNVGFRYLYGAKLLSKSEEYLHLEEPDIVELLGVGERIFKSKKLASSIVFIVINRSKIKNVDESKYLGLEEGVYLTDIYFFSFEEEIIEALIKRYGGSLKRMSGIEIANALYKSHSLENNIFLKEGYPVREDADFMEEDISHGPISAMYSYALKNALKKKNIRVFIGHRDLRLEKLEIQELLREKWEGTFWIVLDFSDMTSILKERKASAIKDPEQYRAFDEALELYEAGKVKFVGLSVYFFSSEETTGSNLAKIQSIFKSVSFQAVESVIDRDSYVYGTPIEYRDRDYIFLWVPEISKYLLFSGIEKLYRLEKGGKDYVTKLPKEIDVYGVNIYNDYVSVSFADESVNPHRIVIAPSGSGKSVFMNKEKVMSLGIDIEKLLKSNPERPLLKGYVRDFDFGYSGYKLADLLKKRGYTVEILSPELDKFRYNICEIDNPSDLFFAEGLISLILQLKGEEPLKAREVGLFNQALNEVYKDPKKRDSYIRRIKDLKEINEDDYYRLKELGYTDFQTLEEINTNKHVRYKKYKMPIISDVIRYLKDRKEGVTVSSEDKKIYESLISKLSSINSIPQFNSYSNIYIKSAQYMYFEMYEVRNSDLFPAIFLAIYNKVYQYDTKISALIKKKYYFEEAHNLLRHKLFYETLMRATREARKHRIYLTFISQNLTDINKEIFDNIGSKIYLPPPDEGKRKSMMKDLELYNESKEAIRKLLTTPIYTSIISYGGGVITLKQLMTKNELNLYNPMIEEMKTEDGLIIRKPVVEVEQ